MIYLDIEPKMQDVQIHIEFNVIGKTLSSLSLNDVDKQVETYPISI